MRQVSGSGGPRWRDPSRVAALAVLGGLCALAVRQRTRSARRVAAAPGARTRVPVRVELPADRQPHDGLTGTWRQLVFLEGGPADGSRVALDWQVVRHEVTDADHGRCTYLDSGRTRPDALGEPARVFVAG